MLNIYDDVTIVISILMQTMTKSIDDQNQKSLHGIES